MDISETTAPKSDQQQFDAYLGGKTRIVTVSGVTAGSPEQPVNVELAEYPGHPFRPNKTMRRLLVLAWGADSTAYIGRRLELAGNPGVVYGGKAVGGVEIAAMSHLEKPLTVALTATRGKRKNFTVAVLAVPTIRDWYAELATAGDSLDAVKSLGTAASAAKVDAAILTAIRDRYTELRTRADVGDDATAKR